MRLLLDKNLSFRLGAMLRAHGHVEVDEHGDGTLRFQVPETPPGAYVVYVDCPECFGQESFIPVGEFEVLQGTAGRADEAGLDGAWVVVGVAVAIVAAALVVWGWRRPTDTSDSARMP